MLADLSNTKIAIITAGYQGLEKALATELGLPLIKKANKDYEFLLRFYFSRFRA